MCLMKNNINYGWLNSHITVPTTRKTFWIHNIHSSYNQYDTLVAGISPISSVLISAAEMLHLCVHLFLY